MHDAPEGRTVIVERLKLATGFLAPEPPMGGDHPFDQGEIAADGRRPLVFSQRRRGVPGEQRGRGRELF